MQNWETIVDTASLFGLPYNGQHTNYAEIFYPNLQNVNSFQLNTKIKDIIGTPAAVGFTNLRLKHEFVSAIGTAVKVAGYSSASIPWDSSTVANYEVPYVNGMQPIFTVSRFSIPALPIPGTYNSFLKLEIWGFNASNVDTLIDIYTFEVAVYDRVNANIPFILAHKTKFVHTLGNPTLPTKKIWLTADYQILRCPPEFVLSSNDPNVVISSFSTGYRADLTGAVIGEVNITLNTSFLTAPAQPETSYTLNNEIQDLINGGFLTSNSFATIEILAYQTSNLTFYSTFNLSFASNQFVSLNNLLLSTSNLDFSIYYSESWMYALVPGSPNHAEVSVHRNSYPSAGTYTGYIELKLLGNVKHRINITHIINNFITFPYLPFGTKAFTLDTKFFTFPTNNVGTYFQFDFTVSINSFLNSISIPPITIKQKIVPFQGNAKLNIGQIIHKLMDRFINVNNQVFQYVPAVINFTCYEKSLATDAIVNQIFGTTYFIEFVAGLSKNFNHYGFLNLNHQPTRVTKKSFALLNYLDDPFTTNFFIYKNNILIGLFATNGTGEIQLEKVYFNNYQVGDVIKFELNNSSGVLPLPSKSFIVFPEGRYSNMIVWEDEFLLQSALEFTGSHNIKTDFEFQSFKKYEDLVEHLQIIDTPKEVKLTINTGWLLKTDVDSIESLMRSKRAWIVRANDTVELRPISKSIINEDSERELIEYTVEFLIQRKYNEETYSL